MSDFGALKQIFVLQYAIAGVARSGIEGQHLVVWLCAAAGKDRDAASEYHRAHDFAMRLVPQQEADFVVAGITRFFAMAPRGHAVIQSPQRLMAVFLSRKGFQRGLSKQGGPRRPMLLESR